MEKQIILEKNESKDIIITRDGEEKIIIKKENRIINADEIFKLFDHSRGDRYILKNP